MILRVMLAESEPEEVVFLKDALQEAQDAGWLREWARVELLHAASWQDAAGLLSAADGRPHIVLLNPDLADSQGAGTFRRFQAVAPEIPVVLLLRAEDRTLAEKLMREGAQDFLFRKQVDCAPLSHAMRNAILRHRLLTAARAAGMIDSLTGLPNRAMFELRADRDRKLAERMDRRWMVLIVEPRNLEEIEFAYGEQRRDLALVETADQLRSITCPADTVSRIGSCSFAVTVFDTELETVEEAWIRVRSAAAERRLNVGASIFDRDRPLTLEALIAQARQDLTPAPKPGEPQKIHAAGAG